MTVGDFPLEEKIVVITGGGSGPKHATHGRSCGTADTIPGICLAFARLAAAQNNRVIIVDIALTPEAATFIREANETGKSVHFLKCDVTNWADLENIVTFSEREFSGDVPDVYIGGAGVFEKARSLPQIQTAPPNRASNDSKCAQ